MERETPDCTRIVGAWDSGGKYPDRVKVRMSDQNVLAYRLEGGSHPGFIRSMEILRSWRRGRHERRDRA